MSISISKKIKERSRLTKEEWKEYTKTVWSIANVTHPVHPAVFPLEIPHRLIKLFTYLGETVLDPFSGGGAIPLEALRLGCETYASDYNPVAVIIEKSTLEYPQKYGKKLIEDFRLWSDWVIKNANNELEKFYPQYEKEKKGYFDNIIEKYIPIGYIWAKTAHCQNPNCGIEILQSKQA